MGNVLSNQASQTLKYNNHIVSTFFSCSLLLDDDDDDDDDDACDLPRKMSICQVKKYLPIMTISKQSSAFSEVCAHTSCVPQEGPR